MNDPAPGRAASTCRWLLVCMVMQTAALCAVDVSIKITDSLGRPLPDAKVNLHWLRSGPEKEVYAVKLADLASDDRGIARGHYDADAVPDGETVWAEISKPGYSGYTSGGVPAEFILKREFIADDVPRVAKLAGQKQIAELRELLAGALKPHGRFDDLIFVHEDTLRPTLRALLKDPVVGPFAGEILALSGVASDIELLLDAVPQAAADRETKRLPYATLSAILNPTTEREWTFLRRCALDAYDAPWIASGAITSLKLSGSAKSIEILKEAARQETASPTRIQKAIAYIESAPPPLSDQDLKKAGELVAKAIGGEWTAGDPIFNQRGDKALLPLECVAGSEVSDYAATFHRVAGVWTLRALRLRSMGMVIRR